MQDGSELPTLQYQSRHRCTCSKFVGEVLLCFSEIELVDQEKFAAAALFKLADQKRVQGTRPWIWEECAFPTVLLVDYEVELVEVVFGCTCFFPGFFRKNSVKFCGDDELLPRAKPVEHRTSLVGM